MAMTITKAKAALKEELAGGTTAQAVEQAFLKVVKSNTEITSGDDISKITKAALLFTHSDKNKDDNAEDLTKKLTSIMNSVQDKRLNAAKKIVKKELSQQPATTQQGENKENTAPTQTDVGAYTEGNCNKLYKLFNLIDLGDKLGLTSISATEYLDGTMSGQDIHTIDLKDEIKAQVIEVQKEINTALKNKLEGLPPSNFNKSLQAQLKRLDNGKMAKTQDYNDLYDDTTQLERDTKAIGEKFDGIISDDKIQADVRGVVKETKESWASGKSETNIKDLNNIHIDLKTEYPSGQNLKTERPSKRLSFIHANKDTNVGDSKDTNKENKGPSNRGPN